MNSEPVSRFRSVLRWIVPVTVGLLLLLFWGLFLSGGMQAIRGWWLLSLFGLFVAPLMFLIVVVYALVKRRFSGPIGVTLGLALLALWPGAWLLNLLTITFPVSLEETGPSATVRLPSNELLRVGWGGDYVGVNYHAAFPEQRWAYDLMVEPAVHGSLKLEDYGCYGTPVVAPVTAYVHDAIDGEPDQEPGKVSPDVKDATGNSVVLRLETGTYLIIGHLKQGSVRVRGGDRVMEGELIGLCGNSGNTSEPHIHIHHQRQDPKGRIPHAAEGLPLYFRDHDGPAMPEGGLDLRDGKVILLGDIVKHQGGRK